MSLIVETGAGLSTAQSYIIVADADAYFLARAETSWGLALTAAKEAALVRGTAALDAMFIWSGVRYLSTQALAWPRLDVYDSDGYQLTGIPQRLKNANAEAALIELGSAGALAASLARGGMIKRKTVGPLTTEYYDGAPSGTTYPSIRNALRGIIPEGGGIQIRRVS